MHRTGKPAGVDLWILAGAAFARLPAHCPADAPLDHGERDRLARLRRPQARRRFLAARLLARHALAGYAGVPPATLRFGRTDSGRPELAPNPWQLTFNLTHTTGLVALAVTAGQPCGVDAEPDTARPGALRFAARFLADTERVALAAAPQPERTSRFVELWVLKESYLKALGTGLRRRLDSFAFERTANQQLRLRDPVVGPRESARWQFELLHSCPQHSGDGHTLAVAVRREHAGSEPLPVRRIELSSPAPQEWAA